ALPISLGTQERIAGVGGMVDSVVVDTAVQLFREFGGEVTFRGQYAAVTDPGSLDMSVLGRDITSLFAVIVDRPGNVVCLLGQRHRYAVVVDQVSVRPRVRTAWAGRQSRSRRSCAA